VLARRPCGHTHTRSAFCDSICTFVLVKQVKCPPVCRAGPRTAPCSALVSISSASLARLAAPFSAPATAATAATVAARATALCAGAASCAAAAAPASAAAATRGKACVDFSLPSSLPRLSLASSYIYNIYMLYYVYILYIDYIYMNTYII
jgi:hypothetical protein